MSTNGSQLEGKIEGCSDGCRQEQRSCSPTGTFLKRRKLARKKTAIYIHCFLFSSLYYFYFIIGCAGAG